MVSVTAVPSALGVPAQDPPSPPARGSAGATSQPGTGVAVKVKQESQLDAQTDGASICDTMSSCGTAGLTGKQVLKSRSYDFNEVLTGF